MARLCGNSRPVTVDSPRRSPSGGWTPLSLGWYRNVYSTLWPSRYRPRRWGVSHLGALGPPGTSRILVRPVLKHGPRSPASPLVEGCPLSTPGVTKVKVGVGWPRRDPELRLGRIAALSYPLVRWGGGRAGVRGPERW